MSTKARKDLTKRIKSHLVEKHNNYLGCIYTSEKVNEVFLVVKNRLCKGEATIKGRKGGFCLVHCPHYLSYPMDIFNILVSVVNEKKSVIAIFFMEMK